MRSERDEDEMGYTQEGDVDDRFVTFGSKKVSDRRERDMEPGKIHLKLGNQKDGKEIETSGGW